jgi:tRNA1(Val) A37 N6-methylase TrmN6
VGAGIVRPARRPAGWVAPGPSPRGADGRLELQPAVGEDLCFLVGEWRIFQRLEGHRWSIDDLVTAWFACRIAPERVRRAIDLGCGIGSVLMMVAWRCPDARCVGVEAQAVSAALARRSVVYNGIEHRCEVRDGDLRDAEVVPDTGRFDLVTGTPPYFPFGRGRVSSRIQCGPCRFEYRGGVEDYCAAAARLLAPGGRFVVCESADQVARVEAAAAAVGLAITARCDVVPRAGKAPLFSVFEMRMCAPDTDPSADAGAAQPVEIVRLEVRDATGQWTEALLSLRHDMGMPPPPERLTAPRTTRA